MGNKYSTNLCTMVTLGKWQGDRYTQGNHYIQVNFAENIRQLKVLGSSPVTVIKYPVSCAPSVYAGRDCKNFQVENVCM